jgi:demethylmenaquinone methyltransferase/2-methoxy-6-polyprenyl-1,4-benzoquinol methylase
VEPTSDTPSWDTDRLPEGQAKVTAVREMFDAIAPRYDLVNRIMTFRLDTRWRRKAVRLLGLPSGSLVLDLASGTGDLCVDLARAGIRPLSMDLSFGMLAADRSGAPRSQADILNLPIADASVDGATCGFALRNLLDLPSFFARAAVSRCSMWVFPATASFVSATASISGASFRASADGSRTPRRIATCPRVSRIFPSPT